MRSGVRIGVDVGTVRIGVSRSDPHGLLATPLETVARAKDRSDLKRILELAAEWDAIEIIVGLPLALSGVRTASTEKASEFAAELAGSTLLPVREVDERLSTVSAQAALRASGRTVKNSRSVVDQVAATIILQHALDAERAGGKEPGTLVGPESESAL
jgi:putative Holliday junction resolvase